ncbi:MAG: (d)CMP kinase [Lachnospiraceae bacterium]|nr:(d)CMP kinase [Lachnospiraceae bacterium]
MRIAIDGPAGAGKSAISDEVAKRLSILHLDTGAMYRAVALACLQRKIDLSKEEDITRCCRKIHMDIVYKNGTQHTIIDGEDVTDLIRQNEVGDAASRISMYSGVRKLLVESQRNIASSQDIIMDGRDIATNVLPDAEVKIYLTADIEERARRRCLELQSRGVQSSFEDTLISLRNRDYQDLTRENAPLHCAFDAVVIDTTTLTFNESIDSVLSVIKQHKSKL